MGRPSCPHPAPSPGEARSPGHRGVVPFVLGVAALALVGLALVPLGLRLAAHRECQRLVAAASAGAQQLAPGPTVPRHPSDLLLVRRAEPVLASWGAIGGCGVGGGATTGGQVKWVGRGVSGGLLDVQTIASQTFYSEGGYGLTLNTRLGTTLANKWLLALNVPFRYNVQEVDVFGETRTARLPGWGDLGLEMGRKLGVTNASTLLLNVGFPTGAEDAVRQGVLLPRQQQLGTGTVTAGLTFEHTFDRDWGLVLTGATVSYGGWENKVGDRLASTGSAYAYAGYIIGPLVPSLGLTVSGKFYGDQERSVTSSDQAMVLATVSCALEWAIDWLAVLVSGSPSFATSGLESWTVGLGLQTSLF